MTSYVDRLGFTILTAWFLQGLQRLSCFAQKYIRTVASLVGDGLFFACLAGSPASVKTTRKTAKNNPDFHPTPTKRMVWGFPPN